MSRVRTFISAAFFGAAVVVFAVPVVAAVGVAGNAPVAFVSGDDGDEWIG